MVVYVFRQTAEKHKIASRAAQVRRGGKIKQKD